jgi:tetratricopeptide (TPR) repeat protein
MERGLIHNGAPSGSAVDLEILLLGGLQICCGGVPLKLGGQRQVCVLAVLLLNHGRTVARRELAEWAWPSAAPETVDRQIANYISALRRALEPAGDRIRLPARRPGFAAVLDPGLPDSGQFAELLGQARRALAGQEFQIAEDRLRTAISLWRGPALDGLDTPYLRGQAQKLEEQRRDATLLLARIDMEAGRAGQAAVLLRDLAAQYPDNEAVATALVRALSGAGHTVEAAKAAARAQGALTRQGRLPTAALLQAHSDALAGRSPGGPARPAGPRHQLPADTGAFTGREEELAELERLAKQAQTGQNPGAAVVCALDGMAGVGKSALAVHAAHRLLDQFPDGQLVVDLRGHTDNGPPRDPADALAALLQALGVAPQQIPDDLDTRAALYRDRLAGTRTLILLDNAAHEAQIGSLLPADGRCLVLITSRRRLKALDDAHILSLDLLPMPDAVALLRRIVVPDRSGASDPLLEQIAARCGRLPLALRIAAALLRHRPAWPLERLLRMLQAAPASLDPFFDGDRNLGAVFHASYRCLTNRQQDTFRSLGLIAGPDVDAFAAAALLGTEPDTAEMLLQGLVDHNLLAEPDPGRYRMHDLIRLHSAALAANDPAAQCDAALGRLLDYYQYTALLAAAHLARHPQPGPAGPVPAHLPGLPDAPAARAWLRAERPNLEAAFDQAAARDWDGRVVALGSSLGEFLRADGPWPQARRVHILAEAAAGRLGDQTAQAAALTALARARHSTGDYPGGAEAAGRALALYRTLGDRLGQARALADLGHMCWMTGDYPGAAPRLRQAVRLFRAVGDRRGQARVLTEIGEIRRMTGDFPGAARDQAQALAVFRALGDRAGQARALTMLGEVRCVTGDFPDAKRDLEQALEIYRDLGHRFGVANVLTYLGDVRAATGDCPGARSDLEQALEIYRDLGSRGNEAWALNHYAALFARVGDQARALALYRDALALSRDVTQPDDEAVALEGIGECLAQTGDAPGGTAYTNLALEIYQRLGMNADVERVRARPARPGA